LRPFGNEQVRPLLSRRDQARLRTQMRREERAQRREERARQREEQRKMFADRRNQEQARRVETRPVDRSRPQAADDDDNDAPPVVTRRRGPFDLPFFRPFGGGDD
jgi:hypothetical protein